MSALKTGCDLLCIEWGPGIILFECRSHRVTEKQRKPVSKLVSGSNHRHRFAGFIFPRCYWFVYPGGVIFALPFVCVCARHHCSNMIDVQLFLVVLSTSPGLRWFLASHP